MEKRKYQRTQISLPVEAQVLSSKRYFHTVSKDISLVGIRIIMNEFIAHDNSLRLDVNLIDRVLPLKAKLIWCNQERLSDRYVVGLEFVELDLETRDHIVQFLHLANSI
nr:probable Type IV pilus assembly protein PilZ [uncultured bacterium]